MADAYIYNADIYCEDCAKAIMDDIKRGGFKPKNTDDEMSYDSDEWPKGPYYDGGGEADSPRHCGSGPDCLDPFILNREKYGKFLENPLTSHGEEYVKEMHSDRPSGITGFWMEFYGLKAKVKDSYPKGECPDCGESIDDDTKEGDECSNCGHVFYLERGDD